MSTDRIKSQSELYSIIDRVNALNDVGGMLMVNVGSYWHGSTRWGRNRIGLSVNRTDAYLELNLFVKGGVGSVMTNQFDDQSIYNAIKHCEWRASMDRFQEFPQDFSIETPVYEDIEASVWSDDTATYSFLNSGKLIQKTCKRAEELDLVASGYVACTIASAAYSSYDRTRNEWDRNFIKLSRSQCSVTARNPKGMASGWSGITDFDFSRVDESKIADKAFDKCVASMNPVRIEPGRYTAILESQAVSDLVSELLFSNEEVMMRPAAEEDNGHNPFILNYDPIVRLTRSKIGLKLFDERITVSHDPSDPEMGILSLRGMRGVGPITYVKDGVLITLPFSEVYSANRLESSGHNYHRASFRMSGGTSTLDEMIATTSRGILVTRFSGGGIAHASSLAATGLTRDGLWLIEDGKITNALRNFRTLESPFFILNNVEQLGQPEKVFASPRDVLGHPAITAASASINFAPQFVVPALKIRDFSFAATVDAV